MTTTQIFTNQEQALLSCIAEMVCAVEPDAEVILYGSHARGDAAPDSDWDLLILLDDTPTKAREDAVCHALYALQIAMGIVLSAIVRGKREWESRLYRAMPFHQNVEHDGLVLTRGLASFAAIQAARRARSGETDVDLSAERDETIRLTRERATQALTEAEVMAGIGAWNTCVNRLYYACFYAATALLLRDGFASTKHTGIQSRLNTDYIRAGIIEPDLGRLYSRLFEARHSADYDIRVQFDEATVRPLISEAQRFVERVAVLLDGESLPSQP